MQPDPSFWRGLFLPFFYFFFTPMATTPAHGRTMSSEAGIRHGFSCSRWRSPCQFFNGTQGAKDTRLVHTAFRDGIRQVRAGPDQRVHPGQFAAIGFVQRHPDDTRQHVAQQPQGRQVRRREARLVWLLSRPESFIFTAPRSRYPRPLTRWVRALPKAEGLSLEATA